MVQTEYVIRVDVRVVLKRIVSSKRRNSWERVKALE